MHEFICKEQHLVLSPHRVIYWQERSALILSDLHFGKTGHFRKAGIPVPQNVYKEDLQRLFSLVQYFNAQQLIIVGDMFHSDANKEMELFRKWRMDLSSVDFQLIKGNHDILHHSWYEDSGLTVTHPQLHLSPFVFCHDTDCLATDDSNYAFAGHIHPGVSIRGLGRQSLHFPCFYFTERYCVLPAFSRFTGTYSVKPKEGEKIFAIVEDSIVPVA